jgi:hypothetical protein
MLGTRMISGPVETRRPASMTNFTIVVITWTGPHSSE